MHGWMRTGLVAVAALALAGCVASSRVVPEVLQCPVEPPRIDECQQCETALPGSVEGLQVAWLECLAINRLCVARDRAWAQSWEACGE